MQIGVIGINHKTAKLLFREKFAKICNRRFGTFQSFHGFLSYVLLSTCNRTEIYFCSYELAKTHSYLLSILRLEMEEEFEHKIYSYFGVDCFFHLACVTAGIDSAILGETEIQGQVKRAYLAAFQEGRLCKELHYLFQKSLKIGKNIRVLLPEAGKEKLSLEEATFLAFREIFESVIDQSILFVGVSEINRKICTYFKSQGLKKLTFCNRSFERLQKFAQQESVEILSWQKMDLWTEYALVICATKAPYYLITQNDSLTNSKRLLIDLSVPRNIDPQIGEHSSEQILLNIDEIYHIVSSKQLRNQTLIRLKSQYVAQAVMRYTSSFEEKSKIHAFVELDTSIA